MSLRLSQRNESEASTAATSSLERPPWDYSMGEVYNNNNNNNNNNNFDADDDEGERKTNANEVARLSSLAEAISSEKNFLGKTRLTSEGQTRTPLTKHERTGVVLDLSRPEFSSQNYGDTRSRSTILFDISHEEPPCALPHHHPQQSEPGQHSITATFHYSHSTGPTATAQHNTSATAILLTQQHSATLKPAPQHYFTTPDEVQQTTIRSSERSNIYSRLQLTSSSIASGAQDDTQHESTTAINTGHQPGVSNVITTQPTLLPWTARGSGGGTEFDEPSRDRNRKNTTLNSSLEERSKVRTKVIETATSTLKATSKPSLFTPPSTITEEETRYNNGTNSSLIGVQKVTLQRSDHHLLPTAATSNTIQTITTTNANEVERNSRRRSDSGESEEFSRLNTSMGYTNNSGHSSHPSATWSVNTDNASDKMETDGASFTEPTVRSERTCNTNEGKHHEDDETTVQSFDSVVSSPAIAPLHDALEFPPPREVIRGLSSADGGGGVERSLQLMMGPMETPSTVSTMASATDDGSLGEPAQHLLERSLLHINTASTGAQSGAGSMNSLIVHPHHPQFHQHHQQQQQHFDQQQQQQVHRRVPSWEASPHQNRQAHFFFNPEQDAPPQQHQEAHNRHHSRSLPQTYIQHQQPPLATGPWGQHSMAVNYHGEQRQQQEDNRYASFNNPLSPQQPGPRFHAPQLPFLPGRGTPPIDNRMPHNRSPQHQQQQHQGNAYNPYSVNSRKHAAVAAAAAAAAAGVYPPQALPQSVTPPRSSGGGGSSGGPRGGSNVGERPGPQRGLPPTSPSPHRGTHVGGSGPGVGGQSTGGNARSSSEILKTLLRKKACLYEPDTSRAVALVTWLVGRELALEFGFFSRQQLQAGVHACVSDKIDSGSITRTKVNRCMQIILNSCFHYIIPRPDGTEENGDSFRAQFGTEAQDDSFLLRMLPEPWNDVVVDKVEILKVSASDQVDGKPQPTSSAKQQPDALTPQSSPHLGSVTPPEKPSPGRDRDGDDDDGQKRAVLLCFNENVRCAEDVFRCHNEFIRDTAHASHLQLSSQEWRLFFGSEAAVAPYIWGNIGIPVPYSEIHGSSHVDALGMMTTYEAGKFRTSWCTKRYEHDHELCGFAHAEQNGGWLRRNPSVHPYRDEMCPSITSISDKRVGHNLFVLNECPHGVNCEYAHSLEEITYHPRRYKMSTCPSGGRAGGCSFGDVCPNFHAVDSYRFPKKSDSRSSRHSRHSHQSSGGSKGANAGPPSGSPLLLASPAPISSFEEHLLLPGLQNLYRRQCSVIRSHLRKSGCTCYYSYFSDDAGCLNTDVPMVHGKTRSPRGLPSPSTGSPGR